MKTLKISISILLLLLASGCCGWFQPRYPILERPQRPILKNISGEEMAKLSSQSQHDIQQNFEKLISYSKKLEVAIDDYNRYANEQNKLLDDIGDAK